MMTRILPLPTILNEESFTKFSSRNEFVSAMERLVAILKKIHSYGFAAQLTCSRSLFERFCYEGVTFANWLVSKDAGEREGTIRNYVRQMILKVPRLEESHASFCSESDFDVLWGGRQIYVNSAQTLPAFAAAVFFRLPTFALATGSFVREVFQRVVVRELVDEEVIDRDAEICSFADIHQIETNDGNLKDIIRNAVLDSSDFIRVRTEMFPNLSFSQEVDDALAANLVDFRSSPILVTLMKMQSAAEKMVALDVGFEAAYGRVKTLAMNESESLRQKIPGTRRFTWPDGKRDCFPHVKVGSSIRIHFSVDRKLGEVYVGYIGKHLPLG